MWTGAAQELTDVAPSREREQVPRFRASTGEMTRTTRAAAAGKAPPRERAGREPERRLTRARSANAPALDVRIGVSNRHVHLSSEHQSVLFGGAPQQLRSSQVAAVL